jgi:hypothetical protein
MKNIFSTFAYLKNFVSPIQPKSFKNKEVNNNSLIVLGESDEAVNHVIDGQIGEILATIGENNV